MIFCLTEACEGKLLYSSILLLSEYTLLAWYATVGSEFKYIWCVCLCVHACVHLHSECTRA